MIDKSRPTAPKRAKAALPAFTPVPRHYQRHDGWTPERQQAFIEALADTGSVKAAAHAVNMTPEGAYLLRRHAEAQEFRKAWEAALKLGVQRLEDVAMERALHGVEVPVYHFGAVVGTRRVYNDRLLMFLLRNRAPKRFGEGGRMNLADRATLANLKRRWRKEWEAERRAAEHAHEAEALAEIDALLDTMQHNQIANMPAKARHHYRAYRLAMGAAPEEFAEGCEDGDWEDVDDDAHDPEDAAGDAPAAPPEDTAPRADDADRADASEPDAATGPRMISLKSGWPDDGRAKPWP